MPRGARCLAQNVFYHIISRGNQKQKTFFDKRDYRYFLALIKKYKREYEIALYGFCLMPNHVHLVLQPSLPENLSLFMKSLSQGYAQYFNFKYNKSGHLWQGRFKSMIIENENYLFDCIKYVEFNPVRAQLTSTVHDYQWSSCPKRVFGISDGMLDPIENIFRYKMRDRPNVKRGHTTRKTGTVPTYGG